MITKPLDHEYAKFYKGYIDLVAETDAISALENSSNTLLNLLRGLQEPTGNYRYAPEKWSVKELVQHLIDSEIVFSYRALSIARGEKNKLPGFEQNEYVTESKADYSSLAEIINLFESVRKTTILLFKSFPSSTYENVGNANDNTVSVRALAFIIAGHCNHHTSILKERYL